tara:strand:- start:199 stop:1944 length:1746 start_codon:yes stop_codon:yes gene_type:complete
MREILLGKLFNKALLLLLNITLGIFTIEAKATKVEKNPKNEVFISLEKSLQNKNLVSVETKGVGPTIEKAIQDAAVNALKQVAGSFMDSEIYLENKLKITNNFVTKTKILNKKIRDYSQGSISNYKIINFKKEGSFYNVNARFDIRFEEFKTYIKKLGYGSKKIKKGLFAQLLTENKESDSKIGFLKKIITPINKAEVIDINVGEPISLRSFIAPSIKDKKSVIAKGYGSSIDSAIQSAAFNALNQVVGSFIDAETYFRYKQEITNAILKKSKEFTYNVKEYSKGSITFFEVINEKKEDNIYIIKAKVTVGLDNFNSYINDLLAFGSNISSFSDSLCMKTFGYDEVCNKNFSFFTEKKLLPDNTILIPFDIRLRNGYIDNTEKILNQISNEKIIIDPSPFSYYNFKDFDPTQDHLISIIDLRKEKPNIRKYILKGVKRTLNKMKEENSSKKSNDEYLLYGISCSQKFNKTIQDKTLEIRFLDDDGNIIKKINTSCLSSSDKGNYKIFETPIKKLHNIQISEKPWISLYTRTNECLSRTNSKNFDLCETQIITKRSYWLALHIENFEILNRISEIEITYKIK